MRFQLKLPLLLMLSAGLSLLWSGSARGQAAQNVFDPDNAFFAMTMEGFFPGESRGVPKRLNMYMQRRDGVWRAAIGTATYQGRAQWNTALQIGDPTDLEVSGDRITGKLKITLVPDPWVPADQKVRQVVVTINGTLTPAKDPKTAMMDIGGEWSTHFEGDAETQAKAHLAAGEVKGKLMGGTSTSSVPDVTDASYDLAMYGLMPGTSNAEFHRRRALSIGVKEGKAVSARLGMMDMRHSMFDYVTLDPPSESEITPDTFSTAL